MALAGISSTGEKCWFLHASLESSESWTHPDVVWFAGQPGAVKCARLDVQMGKMFNASQ